MSFSYLFALGGCCQVARFQAHDTSRRRLSKQKRTWRKGLRLTFCHWPLLSLNIGGTHHRLKYLVVQHASCSLTLVRGVLLMSSAIFFSLACAQLLSPLYVSSVTNRYECGGVVGKENLADILVFGRVICKMRGFAWLRLMHSYFLAVYSSLLRSNITSSQCDCHHKNIALSPA